MRDVDALPNMPETFIEGPHIPNPELCKPCWDHAAERPLRGVIDIEHHGEFPHLTSLGRVDD